MNLGDDRADDLDVTGAGGRQQLRGTRRALRPVQDVPSSAMFIAQRGPASHLVKKDCQLHCSCLYSETGPVSS